MEQQSLKEIAIAFLQLSSEGRSREAFNLFVDQSFKHHNVYFKGDAYSLMIAMEENAIKNPGKTLEVQRVMQDGDYVAVHSWVRMDEDDPGMALVHIFRFKNNRITELWDMGQPVPREMVNQYGMF